ncbi:Clp protease ClpP [Pokkaliibacter plantistimulans]|uniref:Clp protease ClpP n=1 Tax=Proteobacteria bacterium 228 TaxID=2083153 RepID=A0A2S5KSV3_9PROT|nr:S49 family peptidase [Pokkaliibacter plantistimulans]PPC77931.1 Clp protease ClpP [Pokkaliibacter plantistimulans]
MHSYPQLASRVFNTPLLLEPGYARVFFSALASRLGIEQLADADGQVMNRQDMKAEASHFRRTRVDAYGFTELIYNIDGGVAMLPVSGSLVHKSSNLQPTSGMTGYNGLIERARMAFADDGVSGVLLDLHTHGGEVFGCFDTARLLRQMADSSGKPLWALCNEMNCSAGMALASAAHRRLITSTGMAGSVGVIMAHASYQQMLAEEGIKVTLIHSGAFKADGNPYQDLPDDVLQRFQSDTHALRAEFATLVATMIGLDVQTVMATEAACFRGQAAIDVGFADELVNGHEATAQFAEHIASLNRTTVPIAQGVAMSTPTPAPQAQQPAAQQDTQLNAPQDQRMDERTRIRGILSHAEAEGRADLANHLAYDTDMSVEQAAAMLTKAARETPAHLNADTSLDRLMAQEQQPEIGAEHNGGPGGEEEDVSTRMMRNYALVTGNPLPRRG